MAMNRRAFLGGLAATAGAVLGADFAFAGASTDRRLVVVILRGAMDGLHVVAPYADPDYRTARGAMALPGPEAADGVLDLDGSFGLHPALAPLMPLWRDGSLGFVHATALTAHTRSHFDGQDMLENGTIDPTRPDGWLNRAVSALDGAPEAVAVGAELPLILRGDARTSSIDPLSSDRAEPDFVAQVAALYRDDALLGKSLADAVDAQGMVDSELAGATGATARTRPAKAFDPRTALVLGKMLADDAGPRVAVVDIGGWDSHHAEGLQTGGLSGRFDALANGLVSLREATGAAWDRTAMVMVTEFGRTVAGNGTGGTDHGTGGLVWLLGGAVAGGKVHGAWPGLARSALFEDRDLAPANDVRAVLAGVLRDHLGLSEGVIADRVFPRVSSPMEGLIR